MMDEAETVLLCWLSAHYPDVTVLLPRKQSTILMVRLYQMFYSFAN